MKMNEVSATLKPDGTMMIHGHDYSNGRKPLLVWKRWGGILVMRAPSGKCWGGNGMPQVNVPQTFHVFREVSSCHTTSGNTDVVLKELIYFTTRMKKEAKR